MGNTWTIEIWQKNEDIGCYEDVEFWRGESFFAAMWNMLKAKKTGVGCVKLYWRP